jgi:ZIP family zinc transporter
MGKSSRSTSIQNGDHDIISSKEQSSSWRLTVLLFLALLLHNFPEGLAVAFASNASSSSQSVASSPSPLASIVTLSIALHNIPEGIAIAVPCMAARPNKPWLAFGLASLSGLAEPIGAFFALIMIRLNRSYASNGHGLASNSVNMGGSLAFVAGIMMAVAICELIPQAFEQQKESDDPNSFNTGIVLGATVMILTELCIGG